MQELKFDSIYKWTVCANCVDLKLVHTYVWVEVACADIRDPIWGQQMQRADQIFQGSDARYEK